MNIHNKTLTHAIEQLRADEREGTTWQLAECLESLIECDPSLGGQFLTEHRRQFLEYPDAEQIVTTAGFLEETWLQPGLTKGTLLQLGGTGGSGIDNRLHLTSFAAIIAAAANRNVSVVKFGNAGSSSFWRSVLGQTEVTFTTERAVETLGQCRFGVIDARTVSDRFAQIAAARRLAGAPTIFNVAAPLLQPIQGKQTISIIGTWNPQLLQYMGRAMQLRKQIGCCFVGRVGSQSAIDEYIPHEVADFCFVSDHAGAALTQGHVPNVLEYTDLRPEMYCGNSLEMWQAMLRDDESHAGLQTAMAGAAFVLAAAKFNISALAIMAERGTVHRALINGAIEKFTRKFSQAITQP